MWGRAVCVSSSFGLMAVTRLLAARIRLRGCAGLSGGRRRAAVLARRDVTGAKARLPRTRLSDGRVSDYASAAQEAADGGRRRGVCAAAATPFGSTRENDFARALQRAGLRLLLSRAARGGLVARGVVGLPQAWALISERAAAAVSLDDRGRIEPGTVPIWFWSTCSAIIRASSQRWWQDGSSMSPKHGACRARPLRASSRRSAALARRHGCRPTR
jgi:hypothetical protein